MDKSIIKSKRFWTGVIGIITGVSLLLTGEKSIQDPQFIGELFMAFWSFVQTIIALTSKDGITMGGIKLN